MVAGMAAGGEVRWVTVVFTAVGIGDMSGDVFGNGMLLSRKTRLLAAFDHRNIFIDPDPDAEESWRERKRLLDQPASAWTDYSPDLISDGGGVWGRGDKRIELSDRAREVLGIEEGIVNGEALVKAILAASCVACHRDGNALGGIRVDTYSTAFANRAARELLEITNDILSYASSEDRANRGNAVHFRLRELVGQLGHQLRSLAGAKGLEAVVDLAELPPPGSPDETAAIERAPLVPEHFEARAFYARCNGDLGQSRSDLDEAKKLYTQRGEDAGKGQSAKSIQRFQP